MEANSNPNFCDTNARPLMDSCNGLLAEDILCLQAAPLFGTHGFAYSGGEVIVSGFALAPAGNPASVSVEGEPDVAFSFEYPIPSPQVADIYWYWPGAANSRYKIHIDLARTRRAGDFYKFFLRFAGSPDDDVERIRATIMVPKNIDQLQNYPTPDAMQRVMRFDTIGNVAINGATDAHRIIELARNHGFDPATGRVLDWGCGHGRVSRFLRSFGAHGSLHGVDIDQTNIAWAAEHLSGVNFRDGPLMPPLTFDSESFDLVFAISVMTHLSRDVQRAWLDEIRRILSPGGLALLTFVGDSSVAFGSRYHDPEWVREYVRDGVGRDLPDKSLVGVIEDPSYYKNVKLTMSRAKDLCAEYMPVIAAHECMFGYQDLIIMKKQGA